MNQKRKQHHLAFHLLEINLWVANMSQKIGIRIVADRFRSLHEADDIGNSGCRCRHRAERFNQYTLHLRVPIILRLVLARSV